MDVSPCPASYAARRFPRRQHCGISCPAQQLEGDHCVGGEHQQRGIGGGWRHGGQRRGLSPPGSPGSPAPACRLQAREEGQADPAPQIPPDLGVVPEPHTQQTVIENVYGILHCCGRQTAPQGQRPEAARSMIPAGPAPPGPPAVHRAHGQQQKALPGLPVRVGGDGVPPFQQIAEKAVCPKCP